MGPQPPSPDDEPDDVYRECPHCREDMRGVATVCPRCRGASEPWLWSHAKWWSVDATGAWFCLNQETDEWEPAESPDDGDSFPPEKKDAAGLDGMKRCPDCAELVRVEARICRFCRFNFETGIGADGVERGLDAEPVIEPVSTGVRKPPPHVRVPASRSLALEMAWKQLDAGHVKSAIDQGFEAVKTARDPSTLADLAALAATAAEKADFRQRNRAKGLGDRVREAQARRPPPRVPIDGNAVAAEAAAPESSGLSRFSTRVWLGFAASAAMLVGAFSPWAKAIGLLNVSISGTDGSNDGWLVVVAAIAGAAAMFAYSRGTRIAALGVVLAGAAGTAVTYYDRGNLTDASESNTSNLVALQVGWGLNLAMGASFVLAVAGLVALLENQDAPEMMQPG